MLESTITETAGKGFTVIVTEFVFTQPLEFVSVKVYELVEVGETEGLETVELNPEIELTQEQVLPVTAVAPIKIAALEQMAVSEMTIAAGRPMTVIVVELESKQPFVFVSIRV